MTKILKYLSKSNKVVVYSPVFKKDKDAPNPFENDIPSVEIKHFDFQLEPEYSLYNDAKLHPFLKREYKTGNFDVLQLENSLGTLLLMRRGDFPKVGVFQTKVLEELSCWTRNRLSQGSVANYLRGRYITYYAILCEKALARKSNFLIATSKQVREYAMKLGGRPERVIIAKNGVDFEEYQQYSRSVGKAELRKKLGIPEESFVFVFHGSLEFPQNQDAVRNIVKIRNSLKEHSPSKNYKFLIVGGPTQKLEKWSGIDTRVTKDILFTGYVEDVKPYLFSADCALAPFPDSAASGGRIKIIEFLAAGLPLITTRGGVYGLEELIADQPIFIINDFDDVRKLLPLPKVEVNWTGLISFDWSRIASINEKVLKTSLRKSK